MKIIKVAFTTDQNRRKIESQERDIKALRAKLRKAESEVKQLAKQINSLNIGQRRFFQQKSVFTSLQRKIERFEKVEAEWLKFKNSIEGSIKKQIEQRTRAQVSGRPPVSN